MNRLDWIKFWETYDARVSEIREATGAYLYVYHQTSKARALIQELVEEAVASREGSLQ